MANQIPASSLGFGRYFTPNMARMDYTREEGWHNLQIVPNAPIQIDPAASCLHYGQMVFEGMKAFYGADGKYRLYRPARHAQRFANSCASLCIPPVPHGAFVEAVQQAILNDIEHVPTDQSASLYIRPFVMATEPFLGVRPANTYAFFVILSPVGAYYDRGFAPVRIWVEQQAARVASGGIGSAKAAANYASSLFAAKNAKARGYDQVLWTDAATHSFFEEVGTMNLFVHIND
ncbi:MAG: aminotransferase class IV, partial [Myxococcota bacterium]